MKTVFSIGKPLGTIKIGKLRIEFAWILKSIELGDDSNENTKTDKKVHKQRASRPVGKTNRRRVKKANESGNKKTRK